MRILAQKVRLFRMIFQIRFCFLRRGVHPALKICCPTPSAVMAYIFVMNRPAVISFPEIHTHLIQVFSAPGFIPYTPGEDTRMIFVPFQHRTGSAHHCFMPPGIVPWQRVVKLFQMPGTMSFQVRLIHHIDAKAVAQFIPVTLIWIVARPHRIEMVPLQKPDIPLHFLFPDCPSFSGRKLMPVHSI